MEMLNKSEITETERLSYWAEVLREREKGALTIREYCGKESIPESRYYYWQRKLREAPREDLTTAEEKATKTASTVFAEVKLFEQHNYGSSGDVGNATICIEIAGLRLTAGGEYPVEKLSELLRR